MRGRLTLSSHRLQRGPCRRDQALYSSPGASRVWPTTTTSDAGKTGANTPAPQSTDASRQTIIDLPDRGSPSKKSKAHAERPATQPATKRWRATAHLAHHNGPPTAARQIYAACDAICALDPPVQGKKAARAAAAGQGVTHTADIVMRRWQATKLVKMFPLNALCGLSGLSPDSLARRDPNDIAQFLFAKFGKFPMPQ